MRGAIGLHRGRVVGVEDLLPGNAEHAVEVAHDHPFAGGEFGDDRWVDRFVDPPDVGQRRGAQRCRRLQTVEVQMQGPRCLIGALVVQEDLLAGRIVRRRVDLPLDRAPRRGPLVVHQRCTGERADHRIEPVHPADIEPAKEHRSVLHQTLPDRRSFMADPAQQIGPTVFFDDERQREPVQDRCGHCVSTPSVVHQQGILTLGVAGAQVSCTQSLSSGLYDDYGNGWARFGGTAAQPNRTNKAGLPIIWQGLPYSLFLRHITDRPRSRLR